MPNLNNMLTCQRSPTKQVGQGSSEGCQHKMTSNQYIACSTCLQILYHHIRPSPQSLTSAVLWLRLRELARQLFTKSLAIEQEPDARERNIWQSHCRQEETQRSNKKQRQHAQQYRENFSRGMDILQIPQLQLEWCWLPPEERGRDNSPWPWRMSEDLLNKSWWGLRFGRLSQKRRRA